MRASVWSARLVVFGRCAIVRFLVAARCAFLTLRFAASVCLLVATRIDYPLRRASNHMPIA